MSPIDQLPDNKNRNKENLGSTSMKNNSQAAPSTTIEFQQSFQFSPNENLSKDIYAHIKFKVLGKRILPPNCHFLASFYLVLMPFAYALLTVDTGGPRYLHFDGCVPNQTLTKCIQCAQGTNVIQKTSEKVVQVNFDLESAFALFGAIWCAIFTPILVVVVFHTYIVAQFESMLTCMALTHGLYIQQFNGVDTRVFRFTMLLFLTFFARIVFQWVLIGHEGTWDLKLKCGDYAYLASINPMYNEVYGKIPFSHTVAFFYSLIPIVRLFKTFVTDPYEPLAISQLINTGLLQQIAKHLSHVSSSRLRTKIENPTARKKKDRSHIAITDTFIAADYVETHRFWFQ
eukprot:PhF_6_TR26019/c0_g1_i1/m.36660